MSKKTKIEIKGLILLLIVCISGIMVGIVIGVRVQARLAQNGSQLASQYESLAKQRHETNETLKRLVQEYNKQVMGYNSLVNDWNTNAPMLDSYRAEHPDGTTGSTYTRTLKTCLETYQLPLDPVLKYQGADCPKQ
jgi:Na+-translocating ferredoxin:NAD+ oxidoreductase RnfG subunit